YYEEERVRREEQEKVAELRQYEETIKRERLEEMRQREKKKKKKKKNMMFEARNDYYEDVRPRRDDRQIPERNRSAKRKPVSELGGRFSVDYTPTVKRRRGGGGK
ncbi:hypothetical protein Tco_0081106, partial [Tanacetum coccineum]